MPRRRKSSSSSSAFEFTGEEAIAAERAFKQRNRTSLRRPKISVTSISPLSTITKVLHSRSQKSAFNNNKASVPQKTSKPSKPSKTASVAKKPPTQILQTRKRIASPASDPSSPSTPSRRSLRKRLPSFKLRRATSPDECHPRANLSSPVHVRVRVRTPRNSSNHSKPDLRVQQEDHELSTDIPLGHPETQRGKRPRHSCEVDDHGDMTSVPQVKKPRSDVDTGVEEGSNDVDASRRNDAEHGAVITKPKQEVAHEKHPVEHENGTENQHRDHSGVDMKKDDKMDVDSVQNEGTKVETGERTQSEHVMEIVQKDGDSEEKDRETTKSSTEDVPKSDPSVREKKPSADITEPKPCVEDKASTENDISPTDTKPSTEQKQAPKVCSSDNTVPSAEQPASSEADPVAHATPSVDRATLESSNLFESPVTPLKSDLDTPMPDTRSEVLPTNQQQADTGHEGDVTTTRQDKDESGLPVLPVSTATTPEKKTAASTDTNPATSAREVQDDQEVIPDGPATKPAEGSPISAEADGKESVVSKVTAPVDVEQKTESDQVTSGLMSPDELKRESGGKHDANADSRKEATPSTLSTKMERKSPTKPPGAAKRVRFSEPAPFRSSERKLGFSGIVKMRRRKLGKPRDLDADNGDVSVAAAGTKGPDDKGRHLLLDELQYLLDGIFKTSTNGGKKGQTADDQVVASSLQSLIKLLLRKSKTAEERIEEGQEHNSGVVVQILVEQPDLLKTIVKRLCAVLGKSRASDALLALVFVIIFRATPKILLLTEHELDLLLNAFFRNSAASLKDNEPDAHKRDDAKDAAEKEPEARRRGKLGRLFDQKKPKEDILAPLLKLMMDADVIEDDCSAFKRETEAAAHLMGIAISLILRNEIETREWMRDNRRLDRVVAVLYSCEKMMNLQRTNEKDENQQSLNNIEEGASWVVMEASLRILEFAVLDQICQRRLASESRVSAIIISLLRTIKSIKTGPLESEWMICAALRLCINLCHGCDVASRQLVDGSGQNVVLNWLVLECVAAGLLEEDLERKRDDVVESFDVRVLCLAVLASTVNQEVIVCNSFHEMQAEGMKKRERGAISLILEILRTAELEAKKEESKESSDEDEREIRRRKRTTKEEDVERERRAQFVMERKITIGYVCLLVGALACDSKSNRNLIQDLLPGKSFIGVAAVLAEFLEFHHEVGVISGSMNRMYAEIIKKLVEPETAPEVTTIETDLDDIEEDLKVDGDLGGEDLDLLLDGSDEGDGAGVVADDVQLMDELVVGDDENTALTTPVDGTV